jgi:hypothetical protein
VLDGFKPVAMHALLLDRSNLPFDHAMRTTRGNQFLL